MKVMIFYNVVKLYMSLASSILSEGKGILIVVFFVIMINSSFTLINFLYPNITSSDTLPYQLWVNALILFYFILPSGNDHYFLN